jgi:23S rRNA 5-hydroxycytidine C2501 synthase
MTDPAPLELLAPARDLSCGRTAIACGADAVYIGAPRFGARAAAGNSVRDIAALANYAHRFRARVYATLNTLLYDEELEEARRLARELYDAGVDALIIQDMGLLELDLPPLPLFASTQTHNIDPERIRFLEQVGIRRVILARELTLGEISAIRAVTSLELESFVHGALCVSYSGQCYFSHAVAGRSANRGECAQMCRLPYTLTNARGSVLASERHLLSLKDLDLSAHLAELVDAGVSSFKIEGRLKDEAYVANITAFYRARIDEIIAARGDMRRASSGETIVRFTPDPDRTFRRGATSYFLRGRRRGIVEMRTPKSLGAFIGKVADLGEGFFTLDRPADLHNGDGICFFNGADELQGMYVETVEGTHIRSRAFAGLARGAMIYRNLDREFLRSLAGGGAERRIGVRLSLTETPEGFRLTARDADGVSASVDAPQAKEPARDPEKAVAAARTQLAKVGGTIFRFDDLELDVTASWFLPLGFLNRLRRGALESLEAERLRTHPRMDAPIVPNHVPYPLRVLDRYANIVNRSAEAFYRRHGVEEIEKGVELQEDSRGLILMPPRHCVKFEVGLCQGEAASSEDLFMTNSTGRYRLEFNCTECRMRITAAGPAGG